GTRLRAHEQRRPAGGEKQHAPGHGRIHRRRAHVPRQPGDAVLARHYPGQQQARKRGRRHAPKNLYQRCQLAGINQAVAKGRAVNGECGGIEGVGEVR
ncbi:unnamed protein product, partial [Didymodactylos carnosus]